MSWTLLAAGISWASIAKAAGLEWSGIAEGQRFTIPTGSPAIELVMTAVPTAGGASVATEFTLQGRGTTVAKFSGASGTPIRLGPLVPGKYFLAARTLAGPAADGDVAFDVAMQSNQPSNDAWASASPLTRGIDVVGTTLGATREPGEPELGSGASGGTVWWSWVAPDSGSCTVSLRGSESAFRVQVFTGMALAGLQRVVPLDGSPVAGQVTFAHVAGSTYFIAVDGHVPAGNVALRLVGGRPPTFALEDPPDGQVFLVPKATDLSPVVLRATVAGGWSGGPVSVELTGSNGFRRTWSGFDGGEWSAGGLLPGEYTWTVSGEDPNGLVGIGWSGFSVLSKQPSIGFADADPWSPEEIPLLLQALPGRPLWLEGSSDLREWTTALHWSDFDGVQRVRNTNSAAFQFYRVRVE